MKIFVLVKQVPDTSGKVRIRPDGTLDRASMQSIINPDDLHALEAALTLKDTLGCRVIAVTMAPPTAEDMLREVIAMGADEGVLITGREFVGSDTCATSQILAAAIDTCGMEKDDLIFAGRQAIDGETAQVGPQVAERLGIAQVSCAGEIRVENGAVIVRRVLENGWQQIRAQLPCLVTCVRELNTPRYMTVRGAEECFDKPITTMTFETLKDHPALDVSTLGLNGSPTIIYKSFAPPQRSVGMMLEGDGRNATDTLAELLSARHII